MKKAFIKTRNVKNFVALMENLKKCPANIPKMALVYGGHGLGKSQTILWWATNNDAVYVRANQGMTRRWLLSEIAEELGEVPFWHTQEIFNLIEQKLKFNQKIIIVDEVDYLISNQNTIETLRDLHDRTGVPIVLVGMGIADKKIARYKHLEDRIFEKLKFEHFNQQDISEIISQLSDIKFSEDAIEYLSLQSNQFRQIIKLINKIEKIAKTNNIKELDEYILKEILNERQNTKVVQKVK